MITDPQPVTSPLTHVRRAINDPSNSGLAAPIVARNLTELTRRLARLRARGGAYGRVDFSGDVADLFARLELGRDLAAGMMH